mgnify:CR=1 FL=1
MVINFEVNNETDLVTTSYQFLMLSPHKAIDLNKFGNKEISIIKILFYSFLSE